MNKEKIRTYNELLPQEKEVMDTFRTMKLGYDQARFELFLYKLTDLQEKYEYLIELRKETQALLFDVLEEIDENDLTSIYVDYQKIGKYRQVELDNIAEEVNIVEEYKVGFSESLELIYSGVAEELIIQEEQIL